MMAGEQETRPQQAEQIRAAVIGSGISGVAALKQCLDEGFEVECFEARSHIGGSWAYSEDPNDVALYQGCITNATRDTSGFSDFPIDPARYGYYFGHRLFYQYVHEYADHFGLKKHIRFQTRVLQCVPLDNGTWLVRVQREGGPVEEKIFNAVFAATGHLSKPNIPDFPGRDKFKGEFMHSHSYRTPGPFEGKRVAIIGQGSSGVDIACELGPQTKELHVITRRGGWVIPRFVLGKPVEAWDNRATQVWVPLSIGQWLQTQLLYLVDGKPPKELMPDHKILQQNPTIRSDWLEKVRTGQIKIQRGSVEDFTETGIVLSNGTTLEVDVIISATGYDQFHLPYLPADALRGKDTPENRVDLYRLNMTPHYPNLFFIGWQELLGPLPPAAEAQSRHATGILAGKIPRPSKEEMFTWLAKFREWQSKNFVTSERHILSGHQIPYIDELLEPLGAKPSFGRLLGRIFTSGNPWKAYKVLDGVWFGIPSNAQWRLLGHGSNEKLATATILRTAADKKELDATEVEGLQANKV